MDPVLLVILEKKLSRFTLPEILSLSALTGHKCTLICLLLPKKYDGKSEELSANACP